MAITVPWLRNTITPLDLYKDPLQERGIQVEFINYAIPALNNFTTTQHPLIIMDVQVAPGNVEDHNGILYAHDPRIAEIMGQPKVKYHELGLYVLQETRRVGPNTQTPIIIAATINPELDNDFPHAASVCKEMGANEYINIVRVLPSEIGPMLQKYLPNR
jgi:CheY-like chemotaxis protein